MEILIPLYGDMQRNSLMMARRYVMELSQCGFMHIVPGCIPTVHISLCLLLDFDRNLSTMISVRPYI
jgi:hypothetical protein